MNDSANKLKYHAQREFRELADAAVQAPSVVGALPALYQLGMRASVAEQPVWPSRAMWFELAGVVFAFAHMLSVLTQVVIPSVMFLLASVVCIGLAFASMTWVTMYVLESYRAERMEVDQIFGHAEVPAAAAVPRAAPVPFVSGGTMVQVPGEAKVEVAASVLDPKRPVVMHDDHWCSVRRNVVLGASGANTEEVAVD